MRVASRYSDGLRLEMTVAAILITERLVFTPFSADDLPLFHALHSQPAVQRFMSPDGAPMPKDIAREQLNRQIEDQARLGHGKWKARLKDGRFVGRAGVSPFDLTGEVELGNVLAPEFWGQGLATEVGRGISAWTFAHLDIDHIIGFTHPKNVASRRVLMKIGMRDLGPHDLGFEQPSRLFKVDRGGSGYDGRPLKKFIALS